MKHQLRSFGCAIKGILWAIRDEGHLRFHLVAAFYVLLFSTFYSFSAAQYVLLILLIAAVIVAELINTAIENLCDLYTHERVEVIKIAKDVAAGAVLVISIAAVAAAALLFINFEVIGQIFTFFGNNLHLLALLAVSAACAFIFVWKGPKGIASWFGKK